MPEAKPAASLSNPISRYPRIAPEPAQKPKLLDRLRESLRSRYSLATHLWKRVTISERSRNFWAIATRMGVPLRFIPAGETGRYA
jgi:hypothetical protein